MDSPLRSTLSALQEKKKKALIAYVAAGYPPFDEQMDLIKTMEEAGTDILELGIPFSDPIADGPTIQFATQESLKNGTTLKKILEWSQKLRSVVRLPIVYMSYMNPILSYGLEKFARDAAQAGVCGLIVPDLIPEEGEEVRRALAAQGMDLIFMVAPTTPAQRQARIAQGTSGFLYAVSITGVTGARTVLPSETQKWLKGLRQKSRAPVCVGFGISGPDQIRQLKDSVDGFIVGSALIDVIRKSSQNERKEKVRAFIKGLSEECHYGG